MLCCTLGEQRDRGRSYKCGIPQEDPPYHTPWRWSFTELIWAPQGLPTDLQHAQSLGRQQQRANSKRQTHGSGLWSCFLMLLLWILWCSWQRLGWHCQGSCKLDQHLIILMAWDYSLPTGAPRAGPGAYLCVLV